jgi:hypothetical protein
LGKNSSTLVSKAEPSESVFTAGAGSTFPE